MVERPPPALCVGDSVEVIPSERHQTLRRGEVCSVVWHHKDQRWNYYLVSAGRKVSTRYLEEDLRRDSSARSTPAQTPPSLGRSTKG